ncbi:MAG TPA: Chromate resistance protein ChrB [Trebonia sp.]|nr:Chromate resistance protein ChrB [Trebonia sp.]
MGVDGCGSGWLVLLSQLPRTPSSVRVATWRRLRAAGAAMLVSSAWVLPDTAAHADLFSQLRDGIARQGGTGFVLRVPDSAPQMNEAIVDRFRADRRQEYDEFAERCAALLDEVAREAQAGKHTFAEMEETEQDLEKLARWLAKIQARDFFPDERKDQSSALMKRCRTALEAFSLSVYAAEGLQDDGTNGPPDPGCPAPAQ